MTRKDRKDLRKRSQTLMFLVMTENSARTTHKSFSRNLSDKLDVAFGNVLGMHTSPTDHMHRQIIQVCLSSKEVF